MANALLSWSVVPPASPAERAVAAVRSARLLSSDQRGAILVPALVMGAVMTGALFYVAAVGDAIMFRTGLQDAADTTSFTSAVWHARGMNTIVSLNQFMVIVLAVFAVIRTVRLIVLLIPPLFPLQAGFNTAEETVARFIKPVLTVLNVAEDAVSTVVPLVAFVDAKNTPTAADTIWPLGVSLVPPRGARRSKLPFSSLPIQRDKFGTLCGKAVMAVPNLALSLIEEKAPSWASGFVKSWADPFLNILVDDVGPKVFGAGDGIYCQPLSGNLARLVSFFGKQACEKAQSDSSDAERAHNEARNQQANSGSTSGSSSSSSSGSSSSSSSSGGPASSRNRPRGAGLSCEESVDNALGAAEKLAGFQAEPSIVWSAAKNGNAATHIWTWAMGTPALAEMTQQGIGVADSGRRPNVAREDKAVAMAEFYFDCSDGWDAKCEEDAPWAPNWTSRVRRFRSPIEEMKTIALASPLGILDALKAPLNENVSEIVGEVIHDMTGFPEENFVSSWIGDQVARIPILRQISESIARGVTRAEQATGLERLLDARNYMTERRVH